MSKAIILASIGVTTAVSALIMKSLLENESPDKIDQIIKICRGDIWSSSAR